MADIFRFGGVYNERLKVSIIHEKVKAWLPLFNAEVHTKHFNPILNSRDAVELMTVISYAEAKGLPVAPLAAMAYIYKFPFTGGEPFQQRIEKQSLYIRQDLSTISSRISEFSHYNSYKDCICKWLARYFENPNCGRQKLFITQEK